MIAAQRLSIAPMMSYTDKHFRYFMRCLSKHMLLYTEMITTGAILHGDKKRFLDFNIEEHPVALQLGGSDPKALAESATIAEDWGYDEVNLNVGCPSDRVQTGRFGACLMAEPKLVTNCVEAMIEATNIPITVKSRTGIDELDDYSHLQQFIETIAAAGCKTFIIHARKAWLNGLSPKENRTIPPLHYDRVYQIKQDYPNLNIIINGGFTEWDTALQQLYKVDGIMIGRAAYQDPYMLASADKDVFKSDKPVKTRRQIVEAFMPYIETQLAQGIALKNLTRHLLGLFHGQPGAKQFRRIISEQAHLANSGIEVIEKALQATEIGLTA